MFLKKSKNKKYYRKSLGYFAAFVLILVGTWMLTGNMYRFFLGFYSGKIIHLKAQESVFNPPSAIKPASEAELPITDKKTHRYGDKITPADADSTLYKTRPKQGDRIGELYIPKLNVTLPIYHGTDEEELDKGVGHYAGSVLPGENDNSVLSGHRDTVFRKLGEVGEGDKLIVRTAAGEFEYQVYKVRIVDADDRTVIVPKPRATLTVSTCYPFRFIGPAPQRYVLVANLISQTIY